MSTPVRVAGVGVFVLSGFMLFAVALFMIGDRQMAFAKKFTLYTEFTKITGLQPGAIIRVSGAKAGSITDIFPPKRPSEKFRVRLEISEELHQLVRTDSVATIETEGLVGGNYLGIVTGSDTALPAPPDSTIAGKEPFDVTDLMRQMGDSIAKVNDTVDSMQGDVRSAVVAVSDTVSNANALITDVSSDVKLMAASGSKIIGDVAQISDGIRSGRGTIGKLVNDDVLYSRMTAIVKQTEETSANVGHVIEAARKTLDEFQSKDGPVQGMTANVNQTMDNARGAMSGFAENMDALKHNFLLRGFFNGRGYFDLAQLSPAAYRQGALTKGGGRQLFRVWLRSDVLFDPALDQPGGERLTDEGKETLNRAIAFSLEHVGSGILMVEGYAQQGGLDERYLRSRARASVVRSYLVGKFFLDPQATGLMPLGGDSIDSPGKAPWDGVALAVILPKGAALSPLPLRR